MSKLDILSRLFNIISLKNWELRSCMPQGPGVQKEKERKKREKKRK